MGDTGSEIVVLTWTFTPPDYFESEINESDDGRELSIRGGKIEARIDREIFDADADYRKKLHKEGQARFRAVQVLTHQPDELSELSMHILTPDGQQHEQIFPKSSALKITTNKFDQIYTDSEGKVRDTRKERVTKSEFPVVRHCRLIFTE